MRIYSVSELVSEIDDYLAAAGAVVVQGEVSGFRFAKGGNLVYFELKDQNSRVLCFCLGYELKRELTDGMEIRVMGVPKLFKSSGGFHIRVQEVQLVGEGALRQAYDVLYRNLDEEGLFANERKRLLPQFPHTIGLITSPDAAAYTDFVRILNNRWQGVVVKFCPSGVQGPGAIRELVRAIEYMNAYEQIDVLVLTRGGGSLEDLQAFNSEEVVRAIVASRAPVVVGVGHERDETLADYVADVRASTPSNAAERVVPDMRETVKDLEYRVHYLASTMRARCSQSEFRINEGVSRFERYINLISHNINQMAFSVATKMTAWVRSCEERVAGFERLMVSLSPQNVLRRGYSVSMVDGRVVRELNTDIIGKKMTTRVSGGTIESDVITMAVKQ